MEFFNIHFNIQEKLKGDPLVEKNLKKSRTVLKKSQGEGTLWSRPVLYVTPETFLVQFLGPTDTICRLLKILQNFLAELFWSLQVVSKNTDKKP